MDSNFLSFMYGAKMGALNTIKNSMLILCLVILGKKMKITKKEIYL